MIAPINTLMVVSSIFMLAVRVADYALIHQTESLLAANDKGLLHTQKSRHWTRLDINQALLWLAVAVAIAGVCTIAMDGMHDLSTSASTSFIAYFWLMMMVIYCATLRLSQDKHRECICRINKALDPEYSKLGL